MFAMCDKCLQSRNCLHEKHVDTQHCNDEGDNFLIILDEEADSGLNSEIEECIKLLSPEITKPLVDFSSNDSMKRDLILRKGLNMNKALEKQSFSVNGTDQYKNPPTMKEGNTFGLNEKELFAFNAEHLNSVDVDNRKGLLEENILDGSKDNGLNAEIERCIKLLTPTNKTPRSRKHLNGVLNNDRLPRKKLRLNDNEMKNEGTDSNRTKSVCTSVSKNEHKTKSRSIQILTPNTKHRMDVIKNYFLKYSNKDNLINFLQEDNAQISEINLQLLTPVKKSYKEKTKAIVAESKKSDSASTKEYIKNDTKSGIQNESRKIPSIIIEKNKSKSDDSESECKKSDSTNTEGTKIAIKNESRKIPSIIIEKHKLKLDDGESVVSGDKKSDSTNNEDTKTDVIADYYEDEKDDLKDPGWLKFKELTTNEERYQQVKRCWGSKNDLNPNKNLTCHSYRKRLFNMKDLPSRQIKQHKRHASSNLNLHDAKRARPCTYKLDDQIKVIESEKEKETQEIMREMRQKISAIDEFHMMKYQSPSQNYEFYNFNWEHQRQIQYIRYEYNEKARKCDAQYQPQLDSLKLLREEILQFYGLFKDVHKSQGTDPTILNRQQIEELDEIEKIYVQMDKHYS